LQDDSIAARSFQHFYLSMVQSISQLDRQRKMSQAPTRWRAWGAGVSRRSTDSKSTWSISAHAGIMLGTPTTDTTCKCKYLHGQARQGHQAMQLVPS
jgi:hypothetical protein